MIYEVSLSHRLNLSWAERQGGPPTLHARQPPPPHILWVVGGGTTSGQREGAADQGSFKPWEIFLMSHSRFEGSSEGPCWSALRSRLERRELDSRGGRDPTRMLSPRPPGVLPERTASSPRERTGVSGTDFGGCWEVQTGAWGEEGCFYLSCHLCLHGWQRRDEAGQAEATPAGQGGK